MATTRCTMTRLGNLACLGAVLGSMFFMIGYSVPSWIVTSDGQVIGLWNCDHGFGNVTCEWLVQNPDMLATVGVVFMSFCCLYAVVIFCGVSCLRNDFMIMGITSFASASFGIMSLILMVARVDALNHALPDSKVSYGWSFDIGVAGCALHMLCSCTLLAIACILRDRRARNGAAAINERLAQGEAGRVQIVQHARSCAYGERGNPPYPDAEFVAQLGYGFIRGPGGDFIQDYSLPVGTTHTV